MVKRPDLIKRNKERTQKRIKIICPCGKEFKVLLARVKEGAKYCSQKCYHKYTSHARAKGKHWKLSKETKEKIGLSQIGKKNHNWKGGITNPRMNNREKRWVRAVKKRDKFCFICGGDKELKAHHLESFDIHPELRYDLKNGIVLCSKHHKEFHKKYGYGKNTKKQFEEFITEKIESIEKIEMNKSIIYNISLEGDSPFYANGILTHNTSPHYTSPENLKAWARRVLKDSKLAYPVAAKIGKFGTEAQPSIRPAMDQVKNIWIKRYMEKEFNKQ